MWLMRGGFLLQRDSCQPYGSPGTASASSTPPEGIPLTPPMPQTTRSPAPGQHHPSSSETPKTPPTDTTQRAERVTEPSNTAAPAPFTAPPQPPTQPPRAGPSTTEKEIPGPVSAPAPSTVAPTPEPPTTPPATTTSAAEQNPESTSTGPNGPRSEEKKDQPSSKNSKLFLCLLCHCINQQQRCNRGRRLKIAVLIRDDERCPRVPHPRLVVSASVGLIGGLAAACVIVVLMVIGAVVVWRCR